MTGFIVLEENISSLKKREMDITFVNSHIYSQELPFVSDAAYPCCH